jgi:hypothetical protein
MIGKPYNCYKGAGCSSSGINYELEIHNIVKRCKLNGVDFNTQSENELGGCTSKNDLECNMKYINDVSIEIKKSKSPDWMQCSLKYDDVNKRWVGSPKNRIPQSSKKIFEEFIDTTPLFNGKTPPFMLKEITHEDWVNIKRETCDYHDMYIDCPGDTISRLYAEKRCEYIQISGSGLYHLGNDLCGFNVPEFICDQRMRIRTKIHSRKNNKGFCVLSVIIACQPKNIKKLEKSEYSLDDRLTLPANLVYSDDYQIS